MSIECRLISCFPLVSCPLPFGCLVLYLFPFDYVLVMAFLSRRSSDEIAVLFVWIVVNGLVTVVRYISFALDPFPAIIEYPVPIHDHRKGCFPAIPS